MALIAHYRFDGNALDSVGGNHGTVVSSDGYVSGKTSQALRLTTAAHQVHIPHSDLLSSKIFGNSYNFSIAGWVNIRSYANYGVIVAKATGSNWSNSTAGIWTNGGHSLRFVIGTNVGGNPSGSSTFIILPSSSLPTGWFHVTAIVRGTTMEMWIDGELRDTNESGISNLEIERTENTGDITIGTRHVGRDDNSNFDLCDLRFYDHALSPREVRDLSQAKVLHYKFNKENDTTDCSGQGNHGVNNGATWVEDSKIGTGAYEFDNNTNNIRTDTNCTVFNEGTSTVCMWVYFDSTSVGRNCVLHIRGNSTSPGTGGGSDSSSSNRQINIQTRGGNDLLAYFPTIGGTGLKVRVSNTGKNQWVHVAFVWSENNQYAKAYLNGVLSNENNNTVDIDFSSFRNSNNSPLIIGNNGGDQPHKGFIDDVRIYATALSADEIKEIYEQRASLDSGGSFHIRELNQNHPVGGNLVLHLDPASPRCFRPGETQCYNLVSGQPVVGASGAPGSGTHVANPSNFPTFNNTNQGVFDFAGGNKGMNVQEDLGQHDELSICMWFYKPTTSTTDYFTDARNDGGRWFLANYQSHNISYDNRLRYNFSSSFDASGPGFIQQWHFMVAMSNGSRSWLYLNGNEVSPYVSSSSFSRNLGRNFRIGTRFTHSGQWNGYFGPIMAYSRLLSLDEIQHNYLYAKDRFQ